MTPEHDSRLREEEAEAIASRHGASVGPCYIVFYRTQLAALIADVRRQAMEEAAAMCESQQQEPECPERAQYCADAIRAKLEEGK